MEDRELKVEELRDKVVWRPMPSHEDYYEISSDGRARNKETKRELKQFRTKAGYPAITLHRPYNTTRVIHRLMARAFIDNPMDKPQVNHIDGVKHHNALDNLEWVTNAENVQHAYDMGLTPEHSQYAAAANKKECRVGARVFPSITSAAEFLGVSQEAVSAAIKKKRPCCGLEVGFA